MSKKRGGEEMSEEMFKVISNKKLLQDVHTKNQTIREKVELEEATTLIYQTLEQYVEDLKYLQKNEEGSKFNEDIIAIHNAWNQIKTKVKESESE